MPLVRGPLHRFLRAAELCGERLFDRVCAVPSVEGFRGLRPPHDHLTFLCEVAMPETPDALGDLVGRLAGLPEWLPLVRVDGLTESELGQVLDAVRAAQRCLDGLAVRVGARCDQLAVGGDAAPVADTLRSAGQVSAEQARREAARVDAAARIPGVGDALSRGETTGEHVDVLARAWARLDDQQRTRFDTDHLLQEAGRVPVETYRRLVKRHTDTAVGDHGLTDTLARQQRSEFRHWYDHHTGMGRFTGALDPERYETLCNAVEHRMTAIAAGGGEPVAKNPALAAQALVDLVTGQSRRSGLPSITVIVDEQTLRTGPHGQSVAETENGHHLPLETVSRLCCDATLRRVVFDERRVPIDVGRNTGRPRTPNGRPSKPCMRRARGAGAPHPSPGVRPITSWNGNTTGRPISTTSFRCATDTTTTSTNTDGTSNSSLTARWRSPDPTAPHTPPCQPRCDARKPRAAGTERARLDAVEQRSSL